MMQELKVKDIPELKIHGRTTAQREPLTLFWTASGLDCNVSGSELWVEVEVSYELYEPWFSYTVNGDWVGRQMLQKGRYWVPLFRGMNPDKVKNVHFFKDLQAMSGDGASYIHIHGLRFDGVFSPVEEKKRKIEFIGDSITSGEGLFGAREEEDWIPMFFSAVRNYSYLTARELEADYRVFSQSGWGLITSWDNNVSHVIPRYYKEICSLMPGEENRRLGGDQPYDFQSWQPDYVIVNLGTNDAGAFDQPAWTDPETGRSYKMRRNPDGSHNKEDAAAFEKAAYHFLELLRACNPKAHIIWCYGMIGLELSSEIQSAVSAYAAKTGDKAVSYLQLPELNETNVGSRSHPGVLCHRQAAEVLSRYIRSLQRDI